MSDLIKKVLIVAAQFYPHLADHLVEGAIVALEAANYTYDRINVVGVLEIPTAIRLALDHADYDGYVALGVVIRGETTHYEIVSEQSVAGLMRLGINHAVVIGNGIQTVENEEQAYVRCHKNERNKGGHAARACMNLINIRQKMIGK